MIGYLGPVGTFTQAALLEFMKTYPEKDDLEPYPSIYALFEALAVKKISKVFIPIENSRGGEVFAAFAGLNQLEDSYFISDEILFPIKQSLMVANSCNLQEIKVVYAHEQSTRQCSRFLHEQLPDVELVFVPSNGVAAEKVKESPYGSACLGYAGAAPLFNLHVLQEDVHDDDSNQTRFVLISKDQHPISGSDKTSFVFSTHKDKPGSLCTILSLLAKEAINLTRISSKPTTREFGEYLFFVDCDGHCLDTVVSDCLAKIKNECLYYKFLGSYPKGLIL